MIFPALGSRNLVKRLKTVVLPAPLGPISAWIVPRRISRSSPCTAVKPRNSLVRPRVSRITSSTREASKKPTGSRRVFSLLSHPNPQDARAAIGRAIALGFFALLDTQAHASPLVRPRSPPLADATLVLGTAVARHP